MRNSKDKELMSYVQILMGLTKLSFGGYRILDGQFVLLNFGKLFEIFNNFRPQF